MVKISIIKEMAKKLNISNPPMDRISLIRQIQTYEGNSPCFMEKNECNEVACLWRDECQKK